MATPSRKETAIEFLSLAASGKVRAAFAKYVAPDFRHHNPYFRGDAASLMKGMEQNALTHPDKLLEVQHTLEDGDLVAVFSRVCLKQDGPAIAVVHIFRFENQHIAELWDIGQAVPQDAVNENGMF